MPRAIVTGPHDLWLRIEAPYFVAACAFRRDARGVWKCVEAAPILRKHVLGCHAGVVRSLLERKGWRWSWLPAQASNVEPVAEVR